MTEKMNGSVFRNMLDYGVRNLHKNSKIIDRLNVFPVPDGDTGINMVTTIRKGVSAVGDSLTDLSDVAKRFGSSVVFSARGNSGVIVSQFLKGLSEGFYNMKAANARHFADALDRGVKCAYESVSKPVEGTMLTVLKDATQAVRQDDVDHMSIDDVISVFVENAKVSLENTPELLPVLKEAGVVDSGGAGIVYFFEGMKLYLQGDDIDEMEVSEDTADVSYENFHTESQFPYGYCTELLIQLLSRRKSFDLAAFKAEMETLGDSLVISQDKDKVRIHIHTHTPEVIVTYCHQFGEFLALKIENMTVQHTETARNILCAPNKSTGAFSVVAVAADRSTQKLFLDMGADVAICCENGVSAKDYIDAFENVSTGEILVFPNSSDSILTAIQAKKLYKKAQVHVLNSRGMAECYASLPTIDFEERNPQKVVDSVTETINALYVISIAQRSNSQSREYYAFSGKEIIAVKNSLEETAIATIDRTLKKYNKDIITLFCGKNMTQQQLETILSGIGSLGIFAEVFTVSTGNAMRDLVISFE